MEQYQIIENIQEKALKEERFKCPDCGGKSVTFLALKNKLRCRKCGKVF